MYTDGEEVVHQEQARVSAGPHQLHGVQHVGHAEAFHRASRLLHQDQLAGRLRTSELPGLRRRPAVDHRGVRRVAAARPSQLQRPADRPARLLRCHVHADHRQSHQTQPCPSVGLLFRFLFSERELTFTFAICCRLSSVCNARAPYSGGSNIRQYFYGIRYLGHPLTYAENFTEIVRRGS